MDEIGRNAESFAISQSLKWLKRNRPEVKTVISYADPAHGHIGTIYRAANFSYVGESAPDVGLRDPDTGRVYHSRALRTRYNGDYKPFVKVLRAKRDRLESVALPGKHCYRYDLKEGT